jgi:DNA-binding NarL/FixJ family response regulator
LVIDENWRRRRLIVVTLERKFHRVVIGEFKDAEIAALVLTAEKIDVVVGFSAGGAEARALIDAIRQRDERVPVLILSEVDCSEHLAADGMAGFLHFEEWLSVGSVVEELLKKHNAGRWNSPRAQKSPRGSAGARNSPRSCRSNRSAETQSGA